MSKFKAATAAAILGTLPTAALTTAAQADTHPASTPGHDLKATPDNGHPTIYTWQNETSLKFLEVFRNETTDGARVDTFPWNSGNNQRWYAISLGVKFSGLAEFVFENVNSQKCLDDHGFAKNVTADQWDCGNYGKNLRFIYRGFAPTGETDTLRNLGNSQYLCQVGSVSNGAASVYYSSSPDNFCGWQ